MGSWIPLSKLCLCGIVATPDERGRWCWVVDGMQWRYNQQTGLSVDVYYGDSWRTVGNVGTLNHAVAFSLGWRARCQFPADQPTLNLDALDAGGATLPSTSEA